MQVRDVELGPADVAVLRVAEAHAAPGRITVVVGPNAAGKSTLLRALAGVATPRAGSIRFADGTEPAALPARSLARHVAYVPQRPQTVPGLTVEDVVRLGRYALAPAPDHVASALAHLELTALRTRPYGTLSVGQQQRVVLARALAQLGPAQTLILDEPTSAMDHRAAALVAERLRACAADGTTVVVAMHDLTAVAQLADDVWLLAPGDFPKTPGSLVAAGPADTVLEPGPLEAAFGVPFIRLTAPDGRRVLVPAP